MESRERHTLDRYWENRLNTLGLVHMLTTRAPDVEQRVKQQTLIHKSIAARKLSVNAPAAQPTTQTKLSQAVDFARANPNLSRKDMIQEFTQQLGLTRAGATTYYSRVREKLSNGS